MKWLYPFLYFSFLFYSCGTYEDEGIRVTGKFSEILIVCDKDVWSDVEIRNHLDTAFTRFIMPYFPDVQTFNLKHRTHENFDGLIKRHRNVVIINKNKSTKNGVQLKELKDVWAREQKAFEIEFSDKKNLIKFLKSNSAKNVHDQFDLKEWQREIKKNRKKGNSFILNKLKENFRISIDLPEGAGIVTTRKNFFRIEFPPSTRPIDFMNVKKRDIGLIMEGVLVYQYDFIDSSQFELESLLKARDTMLRYNVPHEIDGLYIGTQYDPFVYPESSQTYNYSRKIKGIEIRGMFAFVGKPIQTMGGAFWAFHFLHPKTNKIICISGYLDAPSTTSWSHFMRELQAVWKSVEFNE